MNSRYYDPETGRWVSPEPNVYDGGFDSGAGLSAYNAYAYCANNPVNCIDPTGEFIVSALIVKALIGAAIGFASTAYVDYKDDGQVFNGSIDAKGYIANTLAGGVVGGFTGGVGSSTFSVTIPTLQTTMTSAGSAALVAGTTTVSVTGTQVVGAGLATAGILYFSNRSNKEKPTDKPSWVNNGMVDSQKSAQQNAVDILNNKYGPGNWKTGADTEYNKIVKWITRKVFFYKE